MRHFPLAGVGAGAANMVGMVATYPHAVVLIGLMGLLVLSALADAQQGTVQGPLAKMPGAYTVAFPTGAGVQPRDVVEVRRGGAVLGEALVVEVQGTSAVILPKAGVREALTRGDQVAIVRHAMNAAAIPDARTAEGPSYRAYSKTVRARLIQPYRNDDMIFEDDAIRVKFETLPSGGLGMTIKNKKETPFTIRWSQARIAVNGERYPVIAREAASRRKGTSAVLGGESMRDSLYAYSSYGGARRSDDSTTIQYLDLHLVLHYESGPKNRDFGFELAIVDRQSFFGANVRPATEEEKDNLPPRYHDASVVTQVLPGSPAWVAGLVLGDQIVEIDGHAVESTQVFHNAVAKKKPGERMALIVLRRGEPHRFEAVMASAR